MSLIDVPQVCIILLLVCTMFIYALFSVVCFYDSILGEEKLQVFEALGTDCSY